MKINLLDSSDNENFVQIFTKPLRGVLGGRQIRSQLPTTATNDAIFNVWQRVLVAIILCTIAIPYTIIAAGVLIGKAINSTEKSFLFNKKKPDWLSEINEKALSPLFEGSKINLQNIIINDSFIDEDDLKDAVQNFTKPVFARVNIGNSNTNYIVIPILTETQENRWEKDFIYLEKHPHDTGPTAFWTGSLSPTYNFRLPLHMEPDQKQIQPIKEILSGKVVTVQNVRFKLFE